MTDVKIVGLQHGTVNWSHNAQVYTVYRYGFELARELAIKERARIELKLPHYATVLGINVNEPEDNDFDDNDDDHQ